MAKHANLWCVFALVAIIAVGEILAFSRGDVTLACNAMRPGHLGFGGQSSRAPYGIYITEEDDGSYVVTVFGANNAKFKGFMLQARNPVDDRRVGSFVTVQKTGRIIDCSYRGGAVQHNNSDDKTQVSARWNPGQHKGKVRFRATVVESYFTYWTGIIQEHEV
ncbi:reelin domain-containing protein 1-like [Macrobrachium nipponense]|uniref:reelin domain-containing protein 1-like n=1 Tax=Macrobrachium nipponense TaxID=159736 RepID=UPI0030C7C32A